jgi:hypothetical protein
MYLDIFIPSTNAVVTETSKGVLIDLPGPRQALVYALIEPYQQGLPEGSPAVKLSFFHCLVTEEQLDQIEADNVPLLPYPSIDAKFKNSFGGPSHVFNPIGIVYRENGQKKVHRIKSAVPELLDGEE